MKYKPLQIKYLKTNSMKNLKNLLIGLLLIFCVIFGYKTFFSGDNLYKEKVKQLEAANLLLQKERAGIDLKIDSLKTEYGKLKAREQKLAYDITTRDGEIAKNKAAAARSKVELNKFKHDIAETQNKIEGMKKHPANRDGDDLLNSLKLKTQK